VLREELNRRLTNVDRGTPMGELLRRYWIPVAAASELENNATRRVRVLGENLVLYRDRSGEIGLIAQRCAHRGASLAYGIPEAEGIRCPYHGWLYDKEGHCLEQPAEPDTSTFRNRIRIVAYPVQQLGGLFFAYLGPQPAPLLPRYDLFVWDGVLRSIGYTVVPANWLQIMENSLDATHLEWLHGRYGDYVLEKMGRPRTRIAQKHVKIGFDVFEHGIIKRRVVEGSSEEDDDWKVGHPVVFPIMLRVGTGGIYQFQIRVPIDDTHTWIWWYTALRPKGAKIPKQASIPFFEVPYLDPQGEIIVDTVEGQDIMAWITQGPIADRTLERLGTSDKGIILFRKLLQQEYDKVRRGEDPLATIRDPAKNQCISLPQEEKHYYSQEDPEPDLRRMPSLKYNPEIEQIVALFKPAAAAAAS